MMRFLGEFTLSRKQRFFTEFILSPKIRPFVSLRVTRGEGFRMTFSFLSFWRKRSDRRISIFLLKTIPHSDHSILDLQTQLALSFCFATIPWSAFPLQLLSEYHLFLHNIIIYQFLNVIFLSKSIDHFVLMFVDSTYQIVCHTSIQCFWSVGHYVYIILFHWELLILKESKI